MNKRRALFFVDDTIVLNNPTSSASTWKLSWVGGKSALSSFEYSYFFISNPCYIFNYNTKRERRWRKTKKNNNNKPNKKLTLCCSVTSLYTLATSPRPFIMTSLHTCCARPSSITFSFSSDVMLSPTAYSNVLRIVLRTASSYPTCAFWYPFTESIKDLAVTPKLCSRIRNSASLAVFNFSFCAFNAFLAAKQIGLVFFRIKVTSSLIDSSLVLPVAPDFLLPSKLLYSFVRVWMPREAVLWKEKK